MTPLLPYGVAGLVLTVALQGPPVRGVPASPPEPAGPAPASLERIRLKVEPAPAHPLDLRVPPSVPVATFKVEVQGRRFVATLEEQLHKEFDLTPLQRQQQEWASKSGGLDLQLLLRPIAEALERRRVSRIREQIARELAALQAVPDKSPTDK